MSIVFNPFSLAGKRVLVTGASSGIGRQVAISSSRMGARLVITGRNPERLAKVRSELQEGDHTAVEADLLVDADAARLVAGCGKLDGVVHCAGTSILRPIRQLDAQYVRNLLELNYTAPMMLTQKLLSKSQVESGGSIIFMASIAAYVGVPGVGVYSGTKAALVATMRCLALEVVKRKIRVNCLSPSLVETPLVELMGKMTSLDAKRADHPLGLGTPDDVANATIFFLSDASRWITGSSLIMDGGLTVS